MRILTSPLRLMFFAIFVIALTADANAAKYYVRKTGNDNNNGHSANQAFKTIKKAATVASAGDTVYVGAGTYSDIVEPANDGTATKPIRFVADISGANTGDAGDIILDKPQSFKIDGDDYIEVLGFIFDGSDTMVTWNDSLGGLLYDCEIHNSAAHEEAPTGGKKKKKKHKAHKKGTAGTGKAAVDINNSSVTINSCYIYDNNDSGIHIDGSNSNVLITNCFVMNNVKKGIIIKQAAQIVIEDTTCSDNGDHGIRLEADGSNVIIARCIMQRNKDGMHVHPKSDSPQLTISLVNCLLTDNLEDGIQNHAKNPAVTVNHCTVANNGAHGLDFSHGIGWVKNTILASNGGYGIKGGGAGAGDYNLLYENALGSTFNFTAGSNDVTTSPEFFGVDDYHIRYISMAIDAGTGSLTTDLEGKTRSGPAVDIGCYEPPIQIFFVRKMGDDANDGITPATAFLTINRAASVAEARAIVHVGAGIYREAVRAQNVGISLFPIKFFADTSGIGTGDAGAVVITPSLNADYGWTFEDAEYNLIDGFRITGSNGLSATGSVDITVKSCEIDNTIFGINAVSSNLILENCSIHDTTTAALWLVGMDMADLQVTNLSLGNNANYGLYVNAGNFSFDASNISTWLCTSAAIQIAGINSTLTFDNVTVTGGSTAAVQLSGGTMTASDSTFSGSGYGLAVDTSTVNLTGCEFSGNSVGLFANQNNWMTVTNSTFTGNTLWGASVTPTGNSGETNSFNGCTLSNNAGGMTWISASDGDVLLRDATVIRDNSAAGLHFQSCNLAVNDQAGGANWSSLRNLYGISCQQSTLALTDITLANSTSYAIRCEDSSVSLSACSVTGQFGIYADQTNDSLTIEKSVFDSGSTPGSGVVRYGGSLTMKNTTINGFSLAVYLYSPTGNDLATVLNTTIANSTAYAIYIDSGDAVIRNTILTGSSYGLVRLSGTTTHTNNLLYGFSTPYSGTSATASELQRNPRFLDAANGDFHLTVGSPAINAGLDVGLLVPTDMDGNARPSFNGYEIGAFEYMNANGSFRVLDWTEKR